MPLRVARFPTIPAELSTFCLPEPPPSNNSQALSKTEKYLDNLVDEKKKVLAGQIEYETMEKEVDTFIRFVTTIVQDYEKATYEEKRRAFRMLGLMVFIYREDDPAHERYEMKIRIPDIVSHRC